MYSNLKYLINLLVVISIISSCGPSKLTRYVYDVNPPVHIPGSAKVLKTHMANGDLYVLSNWNFDNTNSIMYGKGSHYNAQREKLNSNTKYSVPLENIALFESNFIDADGGQTGQIVSLSVVSILNAIITIPCISNPKACFGSCPTYYAFNGQEMSLQGEGFSSSMAKVYEKKDIDMLYDVENYSDTLMIEIRNEALETHMIRYCDLIVVPRFETERIFVTSDGDFYSSARTVVPEKCIANEGDILKKITDYDEVERFSASDSTNLVKKEFIDITFPNDHKKYGLVITSRQTLMTTFLFYQTMAYFGSSLPYWSAKLEKGNKFLKNRGMTMYRQLGGIEVYIKNDQNQWIKINEIDEMGPIASDFHLTELPDVQDENINIRLKLTQGLWRIDYITLAELDEKVDPIQIQPNQLIKERSYDPKHLEILNDTSQYLVTFPGEKYKAFYSLPDDNRLFEYFIESKGYYLEWMREEWVKEENKDMVTMLFLRPKKYMKVMAPKFKRAEPFMDQIFWNTRIQSH